jgi:UPF0755 protein
MKKVLLVLLALVVLAGAAAGWFWWSTGKKVDAFESTPFGSPDAKTVVIQKGTDPVAVGEFLARAGVISDAETWHLWLRWRKLKPKWKAGEYEFTGPLTPVQIGAKMEKGEVKLHHFTVAEGLRCDEIMPVLAASDLGLDAATLLALCTDRGFAHKHGLPGDRLEGYLFPDTYSFPLGVDEENVVGKMISRAKEEYARANAHRKADVKLDMNQVFTLASIVEKETGNPVERAHISCLFENRLKKKMKLQTDPTVLYGMFVKTGKFDKDLAFHNFVAAREDHNAYNTYAIDGLPAGPIANPGAAAIEAALAPTACQDLFFVARGDGSGTHIFCEDYDCHLKAIARYVGTKGH